MIQSPLGMRPGAAVPAGTGDSAMLKAVPGDFRVDEIGAFEPEGHGEHLYLRVEKTGLSTPEVARWLAAACGVAEPAVGYAGMKDARAVTEQWFSVHTPQGPEALPERVGVRVRAAARHSRKLRRGQLAGNRFRIRLREVRGDTWGEALPHVRDAGVANFFGPQRFGRDNVARARAWLTQRPRRRRRSFRSGLHLSVLRSFLFNEVLARRVTDGTWNRLLPGDVAMARPGQGEAAPGDGVPTGPLWGRGRSATTDAAGVVEAQALAPHAALCHELEHTGLVQQRRRLVLVASGLAWHTEGDGLELSFTLPPGGYASVLLGAVFDLRVPEGSW